MGMFDNLFKTAVDKSKKVLKEVTEQTENTIKTTIGNIVNNEDVVKTNPYIISDNKNSEENLKNDEEVSNDSIETLEEDTNLTASNLEQELANKINETTDILNAAYNKDTSSNDSATNIVDALNHLIKATNNVGTKTDNEVGKILNESFNPKTNNTIKNEPSEEMREFEQKLQEVIDSYKNDGK